MIHHHFRSVTVHHMLYANGPEISGKQYTTETDKVLTMKSIAFEPLL